MDNNQKAQVVELFKFLVGLTSHYDTQVIVSALVNALAVMCTDSADPIRVADHLADVLPELVQQRVDML
jgi:hypothetical protein